MNRRFHFKEENTSFLLIPNVLRFHGREDFRLYGNFGLMASVCSTENRLVFSFSTILWICQYRPQKMVYGFFNLPVRIVCFSILGNVLSYLKIVDI